VEISNLSQAIQILKDNIYCCLATASKEGMPWNTPVFYSYDHELTVYWASSIESVHSQYLKENSQAFIVIYNSTAAPRTATALYLQGHVETVPDHRLDERVQQHFKRVGEDSLFTGNHYRGASPERLYQFSTQKAWLLGEPLDKAGHLIDIRKELSINQLKQSLKKASNP